MTASGECQGDERERTIDDMSKRDADGVKTKGDFWHSGTSPGGSCLLPGRRPA